MNERASWVDYAKGIGIVLVVFRHVASGIVDAGIDFPDTTWYYWKEFSSTAAMQIFFFLAGLHARQSLDKRGPRGFITGKARAIIYPYVIWSVIIVSSRLLAFGLTNRTSSITDLLAIVYHPLGYLWFLYSLFLIFAIYTLVTYLIENELWLLAPLSLILYFVPLGLPLGEVSRVSENLIFFVGGLLYYRLGLSRWQESLASPGFVALIWALFIGGGISVFRQTDSPSPAIMLPLSVVGIVALVSLSTFLAHRHLFRFLEGAGNYSLQIYLAHILFSSGTRIILHKILGVDQYAPLLLAGLTAGLVLPVLLYRWTDKRGWPYLFAIPSTASS